VDIAAHYAPAAQGSEVGGDFYDAFEIADGSWGIAIGDVCGKGAEAAALTGVARHTLRAAGMHGSDPVGLLRVLNEAMLRQATEERFATVAFARLDHFDGGIRATVVCGGHPLPVLLRQNGEVEYAGTEGTVLGLFPEVELPATQIDLRTGDLLVFYTDGVTEARCGEKIFGGYGLRKAVAGCAGKAAEDVTAHIQQAVDDFQDAGARDDVAILVIRADGVPD
jgi:serine phosphatase RsbU (regulator of sigma subunit)